MTSGSGRSEDPRPRILRAMVDAYRIGEAAKALGVRVETLRRWEREGKMAGPHRVLAFITREAVDQMGLEVGMRAVATVKATSVMVNLPEE